LCAADAVIWFEYGSAAAGLRDRELADRAWHKAVEICEQRDPKGLYAKARAGELKEFTGVSAP